MTIRAAGRILAGHGLKGAQRERPVSSAEGFEEMRVETEGGKSGVRLSTPLLATTDVAAFLAFAVGGRMMHSGGGPADWLSHAPRVAAPFLVGWFAAAIVFGAYPRAREVRLPGFAASSMLALLVGQAIGFAVRAYLFGDGVSLPFVVTAVAFTILVVIGPRLIYFWRATAKAGRQGLATSG